MVILIIIFCKVDNSSITGESEPQVRAVEFTNPNPAETKNLAFFGTLVVQGNGKGMVINIGDCTMMGRIAKLASKKDKTPSTIAIEIESFIQKVSRFDNVV